MKRTIITTILLLTIAAITITTQGGRGTPSSLLVKTDSTGALVIASGTQTPPFTTSVFNNTILRTDATGALLTVGGGGGGGGTPGGADTNIQFNDAGAFGGAADFTWNKTNKRLAVASNTVIQGQAEFGGAFTFSNQLLGMTFFSSASALNSFGFGNAAVAIGSGSSGSMTQGVRNTSLGKLVFTNANDIMAVEDLIVGRNAAGLFGPNAGHSMGMTSKAWINTAPTNPVACAGSTIVNSNGTAAFLIDVGTTCAGITTLSFTLPTATNGWSCQADNLITPSDIRQTGSTTGTATFTNFSLTTGIATAFTDGNDISVMCVGR